MAGIDVGGHTKGFHVVALLDGQFVDRTDDTDPNAIVQWCVGKKASIVAIDCPCHWSKSGSSRRAECELRLHGEKISCFATPTEREARANRARFYDWVLNGQRLYKGFGAHNYDLFDGETTSGAICLETFPHAIVCAMAGQVTRARPKAKVRREALRSQHYDDSGLPNIDYVDAALCAITAAEFRANRYIRFGDPDEGFIVIPRIRQ